MGLSVAELIVAGVTASDDDVDARLHIYPVDYVTPAVYFVTFSASLVLQLMARWVDIFKYVFVFSVMRDVHVSGFLITAMSQNVLYIFQLDIIFDIFDIEIY